MSKKDPIQELVRTYYGNNPFRPNDERVHELEVRFGTKGGINRVAMTRNDYDNVIKKLKSSGFRQTTVDTSGSSILRIYCETNRTIRTDILGLFAIQQYCRTNRLPDNPELCTMTIKQPLPSIKPVDIDDFRFRVSYQTEDVVPKADKTNLENNWSSSKKEFRYLNRVSFVHESFPCIVDISIVKYSSTDSNGKAVRTFKVSDSGVFRNPEGYEFEIEIDPARIGPNTPFSDASKITHALRSVIMLVLSGIQMSNFPISYSEQDRVREEYMALLWTKEERDKIRTIGNKYFMGPQSITLQLEHIGETDADGTKDNNIRANYVVTDKADGMRHLLFVNGKGNIYLIRTNMAIVFTGARTKNEQLFQSILDGELITHDKNGNYIQWLAAFDIYYFHKRDVRALPFIEELEEPSSVKEGSSGSGSSSGSSRYHLLQTLVQQIEPVSILQTVTKTSVPSSPLQLTAKQFFVPTQTHTIFDGCKLILDKNKEGRYPYHIDGLIVSHAYFGVGSDKRNVAGPKTQTTWEYSFKWKPPENNTVDFLVNTVKDANNRDEIYSQFEKGINQCTTVQSSQYKMVELMCGFNPQRDGLTNACQLILNGLKNQSSDPVGKNEYLPMRFYPTQPYDPMAGLCRIPLISDGMGGEAMFAEDGDSFTDHMIVEFRYDLELVTWIPIKVRYDKTSRLLNGEKEYGNSYKTCNDNWKSINPLGRITETMLTTGADIPSILVSEDMYYNTNGGKSRSKYQTTAMKNFHNLFVKHMLLCNMARPGNTLIDFACGKAGDLPKWVDAKYSFVLGIDYSLDNLANPMDGACARYVKLNQLVSRIPDALFLNGNSGKNIRDGTAFFTEMDKQIASAVFGQTKGEQTKKGEQTNLGKGVVKQMGKGESGFSISSCQFAMHYFFESPLMLTHFLRNVMENTQLNGYFVGTCYDGMAVFQELKNVKRDNGIKLVENGTLIWELIKRYDDAFDFQENSSSIGLTVDVFQESIGQTISEYLVHFGYFQRLMDTCGFELLSVPEARAAGFPSGTGMFKSLFDLMVSKTKNVGTDANPYGKALQMTEFEKKISFLNRYFIFKKVREINSNDVRIDLTEYELNKQVVGVKEPPPVQEEADAKAKGAEVEPIVKKRTTRKKIVDNESKDKESLTKAKIAIIVPYRVPVTHASDRAEQLVKFTETMTRILSTHGTSDFKLYVIEQSQDGRLFNRGHLLNIGFSIAQKDGCTNFIFHDVDLLPSESLMHYYINQIPDHKVMHIAGTWGRYGLNATGKINHNYLGGITGFSETTFKEINGFPNNFWGWGGEDDELLLRIKSFNQSQTDAGKQITIIKPGKEEGGITDLENMDITQKMAKLKETKEKGMMKKERLAEHADTYRTNGLSNLDNTFHIISHSACVPKGDNTRCEKWVVELNERVEEKGEEKGEAVDVPVIVPIKTRVKRAKKAEKIIETAIDPFIPEPILAVEQELAASIPVKKPRKPRTKKAV